MNLTHYKSLAHDHWKEFLPSLYRELVENKMLDQALTTAAERTDREMTSLMNSGVPRDQAWEQVRGRYLLMTPETDNDEDYGPNPDQEFHDLIKQAIDAQQALYDEL